MVPVGVYVHIHDIFWPFEYPKESGSKRAAPGAKAYLLHAFPAFNPAFEIVLFNDWLTSAHYDRMGATVPALAPGAGGAIWLRRRA